MKNETTIKKKEVEYYPEIATYLQEQILGNLPSNSDIEVYALIGEIKSALNTVIVNGKLENEVIKRYAQEIDTLHLDVSFLIFDNRSKNYEIVILEVKKMPAVGLTELSQLVGYCLVSKSKFGILVNIDGSVSDGFMTLLEKDSELTTIDRKYKGNSLVHKFGVMKWNSNTKKCEYTSIGGIKSIPELVNLITEALN